MVDAHTSPPNLRKYYRGHGFLDPAKRSLEQIFPTYIRCILLLCPPVAQLQRHCVTRKAIVGATGSEITQLAIATIVWKELVGSYLLCRGNEL